MRSAARSGPRGVIWTVGHGTRTTADLATLIRDAGAAAVIDVRRYPGSRRHPHLARERLQIDLPPLGVGYEWWGEALGGRRPAPPKSDAPSPWRSPGFAAYATHMTTSAFRSALLALEARTNCGDALAIMCAETLWWRCHRRLIADALVFDGFVVRDLADRAPGHLHRMSAIFLATMDMRDSVGAARRDAPSTRARAHSRGDLR